MMSPADPLTELSRLRQRLLAEPPDKYLRFLVLAAHPDDETIGASALLGKFPLASVAFMTDGAPRDKAFWTGGPYISREDYADTRRKEAREALGCAGVSEEQVFWLQGEDQEAAFEMTLLSSKLTALLRERRPGLVITHPYEGGHPDHDSASFIARLAISQLTYGRPEIIEMTSYHARDGECVAGEFLHSDPTSELVFELSEHQRDTRKRMLDAYTSQRLLLGSFETDRERFRKAPQYDFSMAPHDGKLWYECMGWPMTGEHWRKLARGAIFGTGNEVEIHSCG